MNCDCQYACFNCLKHYRNQRLHGFLDRHAGYQLLEWALSGQLPTGIGIEDQYNMLQSVVSVLNESGIAIHLQQGQIFIRSGRVTKKVIVYPAMWHVSGNPQDTIFIPDMWLLFAKPYAVNYIRKNLT